MDRSKHSLPTQRQAEPALASAELATPASASFNPVGLTSAFPSLVGPAQALLRQLSPTFPIPFCQYPEEHTKAAPEFEPGLRRWKQLESTSTRSSMNSLRLLRPL